MGPRGARWSIEGTYYSMPLPAGEGTGLGKPLKIIAHPVRPSIPIWVAALGEKNVAMTAELADGWIPMLFMPEKARRRLGCIARRRPGQAGPVPSLHCRSPWADRWPSARATRSPPLRDLARPMVALYVGGMGAKGKNFYNDVVRRYGYEEEAERIQDLYLDGKKAEAEAAVPDALLEATSLCGPESYVAERIAAFAEAGVTHLQVSPMPVGDQRPVDLIAAVKNLIG